MTMVEDLTQGTNDNTTSANSSTPTTDANTNTQDTILGGSTDTSGNQEPPKEPTVYDFSKAFDSGEVDQTIAADFSKLLNGVGATQEQAVEMARFGEKYATDLVTAYETKRQEALVEQYKGYAEHTKEVLGNKYDETVGKAATGVEVVEKAIPNIRELLAENGLGNRVEIIQLFAQIAGMAGEDNNAGGGQSTGGTQSEDAIRRNLYPSMFK
nr:MAG TPA: putative protease [Caudoviricetes sp.]